MSKKNKKETVGQIIARAPEDAAQFGHYDEETGEVFAHLELLISDLRHGIAPSPDDYELLADILEHFQLSKRRGGSNAKSAEARTVEQARREEIDRRGRTLYEHYRHEGNDPNKALALTVSDLKTEFPNDCRQLSNETIKYRVWRRHSDKLAK